MGGGNRPPYQENSNFTIRKKFDGSKGREFFQHDNRERDYSDGQHYNRKYRIDNRDNKDSRDNDTYSHGRSKTYRGGQSYNNERGNYRGRRGQRGFRGRNYNRNRNNDDGDIQMSNVKDKDKYRFQNYQKRGRGRSLRSGGGRSYMNHNSGWHKIMIKDTDSSNKAEVMTLIKDSVNDLFTPILYEEEHRNLVFFLEKQHHIAKAIITLSGRIHLGDGTKLHIQLTETPPPSKKLTEKQIETIITVMSNLYSQEMKRLDLKNFHNNQTFIQEQIFCPLYRDNSITVVLDIISKYVKDVEEIDLSSNQIVSMKDFEALKECPNLRCINLENNKLRYIDFFASIKHLPIVNLNLIGNPIKTSYKDPKDYRADVAKYFPKLTLLDGSEVDRPIGFAVEAECIALPKSKGSFMVSERNKIVTEFVEQFYQVYDFDNRRTLEAAYTEDASFSITANFPDGAGSRLAYAILNENRNLKTITQTEKKHRLLAKGPKEVVDILCKLPKSKHDLPSFVVDIPIDQPRLIHVTIMGVFKQIVPSENSPVRSFMRSLIIVPIGEGFCICNEELFINVATQDQIRKSFKSVVLAPPVPPPVAPVAAIVASPVKLEEVYAGLQPIQIEMINKFAEGSGMIPYYCKVCLHEKAWSYDEAAQLFQTLNQENKIPPEYFGR